MIFCFNFTNSRIRPILEIFGRQTVSAHQFWEKIRRTLIPEKSRSTQILENKSGGHRFRKKNLADTDSGKKNWRTRARQMPRPP